MSPISFVVITSLLGRSQDYDSIFPQARADTLWPEVEDASHEPIDIKSPHPQILVLNGRSLMKHPDLGALFSACHPLIKTEEPWPPDGASLQKLVEIILRAAEVLGIQSPFQAAFPAVLIHWGGAGLEEYCSACQKLTSLLRQASQAPRLDLLPYSSSGDFIGFFEKLKTFKQNSEPDFKRLAHYRMGAVCKHLHNQLFRQLCRAQVNTKPVTFAKDHCLTIHWRAFSDAIRELLDEVGKDTLAAITINTDGCLHFPKPKEFCMLLESLSKVHGFPEIKHADAGICPA